MNPLFFGERRRRLFGVYQEAEGAGRRRAAVLCPPWGAEYLFTHRALRQLSAMLNMAGFHTLRFDYYGTGDSGGEGVDGDLAGWRADIETAIEELSSMAGVAKTTLVGLRLGGLLAAQVAAKNRRTVDELVMWDPIVSGADYPAELYHLAEANAERHKPAGTRLPRPLGPEEGGGYETNGFALTERFIAELAGATLADPAAALPARTMLIVSSDQPGFDAAAAALRRPDGVPVTAKLLPARPSWVEDWPFTRGEVPVAILQSITAWLA